MSSWTAKRSFIWCVFALFLFLTASFFIFRQHAPNKPKGQAEISKPAGVLPSKAPQEPAGNSQELLNQAEPITVEKQPIKSSAVTDNLTRSDETKSPGSALTSGKIPSFNSAPSVLIEYLRDASYPLEERRAFIKELSKQSTPESWRALKAIGDADIYLSQAAVDAMAYISGVKREELGNYLAGKLLASDPRVALAAIDAYARAMGTDAIKTICDAIEKARAEQHSFFDQIANRGYRALGELASPEAVGFLAAESLKVGKDLDRGTVIVRALANIVVLEARDAILRYADDLASRMPEDPMARAYFEEKIAEARTLASKMGL